MLALVKTGVAAGGDNVAGRIDTRIAVGAISQRAVDQPIIVGLQFEVVSKEEIIEPRPYFIPARNILRCWQGPCITGGHFQMFWNQKIARLSDETPSFVSLREIVKIISRPEKRKSRKTIGNVAGGGRSMMVGRSLRLSYFVIGRSHPQRQLRFATAGKGGILF